MGSRVWVTGSGEPSLSSVRYCLPSHSPSPLKSSLIRFGFTRRTTVPPAHEAPPPGRGGSAGYVGPGTQTDHVPLLPAGTDSAPASSSHPSAYVSRGGQGSEDDARVHRADDERPDLIQYSQSHTSHQPAVLDGHRRPPRSFLFVRRVSTPSSYSIAVP